MSPQEKQALVRRLQAGKRRAKRERPKRLRVIEGRMDDLERQRQLTPIAERLPIYHELADLGHERMRLKWGKA